MICLLAAELKQRGSVTGSLHPVCSVTADLPCISHGYRIDRWDKVNVTNIYRLGVLASTRQLPGQAMELAPLFDAERAVHHGAAKKTG